MKLSDTRARAKIRLTGKYIESVGASHFGIAPSLLSKAALRSRLTVKRSAGGFRRASTSAGRKLFHPLCEGREATLDTAGKKDEECQGSGRRGRRRRVRTGRGQARIGKEQAGRTADYVNYEKLERRNRPTSFRRNVAREHAEYVGMKDGT